MRASSVYTNVTTPHHRQQVLIGPTFGDALLIDMTEASILTSPLSSGEIASVRSFVSEVFSLLPADLHTKMASLAISMTDELQAGVVQDSGALDQGRIVFLEFL